MTFTATGLELHLHIILYHTCLFLGPCVDMQPSLPKERTAFCKLLKFIIKFEKVKNITKMRSVQARITDLVVFR